MTTASNQTRVFDLLNRFEIELPSWGFADTGTRFGKFVQAGAAIDLDDKLDDAGHVHALTGCCPKVALHVLWDFPGGTEAGEVAALAASHGVRIGSINPNLFQNQEYKLGSLCNPDPEVRAAAVSHCSDSIAVAKAVGSNVITLWLADGTNYPGQDSVRARKRRLHESLAQLHPLLGPEQTFLVEYKPFEPAFYHTDIADWGMALTMARSMGSQAKVLVDTGHHYQAQNIEQIVAWLLDEGMLGGFHFNDRRYADDDLTLGSIDPYQVFRIFNEILSYAHDAGKMPSIEYMVDQSHNLKPKIEAMVQTVMAAQELAAKAALVDHAALQRHQERGELVDAEVLLKDAFATDVRPLVAAWREERGLAANPLAAHRDSGYALRAAADRSQRREDRGIEAGGSYA